MTPQDELRLRHMRDAAIATMEFASGKSQADLEQDVRTAYAIAFAIQIVGEAAAQVSAETQANYPEIEWRPMIGMRNRLVHGYDSINYQIVWQVVTENLPLLIGQLNKVLGETSNE